MSKLRNDYPTKESQLRRILDAKNVATLKDYCKDLNIRGFSQRIKRDLINLLVDNWRERLQGQPLIMPSTKLIHHYTLLFMFHFAKVVLRLLDTTGQSVADLEIVKGGGQLIKGGSGGPPPGKSFEICAVLLVFITHFTLADSLKFRLSKGYQPGIGQSNN